MINPLECTQGLPRNQSPYESTLRVKRREPMQSQRNNACGAFDAPCIYTVLTIHKTYIGNNVATTLQTLVSYRNVCCNTLQQQRCLMIQDRVLHDYDGVLHDNDGVLHDYVRVLHCCTMIIKHCWFMIRFSVNNSLYQKQSTVGRSF